MKPSDKRPNTRLRPTPAGAIVDPARAETRTSLLPINAVLTTRPASIDRHLATARHLLPQPARSRRRFLPPSSLHCPRRHRRVIQFPVADSSPTPFSALRPTVRSQSRRIKPYSLETTMTWIPDGWTDDMNIPLPQGVTVERIVDFVLSSVVNGASHESCIAELTEWGLSTDDAALAYDRALGGAFRAGLPDPANAPSPEKDPIASFSYIRCRKNRALISKLFPEQFPRPRWKFWQ